jgi:hypothetical protein
MWTASLAGTMDTRHRRFTWRCRRAARPVTVEILLYTIARVNFGMEVHDRKGLHGPVTLRTAKDGAAQELKGWEIRAIDFDADGVLPPLSWQEGASPGPPSGAAASTPAARPTPSSTCPAGARASSGSTAAAWAATGASARPRPCTCPALDQGRAATRSWCST